MQIQDLREVNLKVFVTHFVPPSSSICSRLEDFLVPRLNLDYIKSYYRLFRYGKRGSTPWRTDIMTKVRRKQEYQKLFYINNLITSFLRMPVGSVEIQIHTNSANSALNISRIWKSERVHTHVHEQYNRINYFNNSPWQIHEDSPWLLTWEHKKTLSKEVGQGSSTDIFICIEDDALFNLDNLIYFMQYKTFLKEKRLIPSFLRTEWSYENKDFVAIDRWEPLAKIKLSSLNKVTTEDGQLFAELPNPYSGLVVLDYEMALEYVASKAIDLELSRELTWWDIGARAAMGLQFVDVPAGFTSRNVVPVSRDLLGVEPIAWVAHQPNLYANKLAFPTGLTPRSLFEI